jgi:hypothetical protein
MTMSGTLDERAERTLMLGSSHLAALVTADGSPFALRGWGARLDDDRSSAHVLLAAIDVGRVCDDAASLVGAWIAYTATDVRTHASMQMKGPIRGVGLVSESDLELFAAYCTEYYDAVMDVDFIDRELMERMEPVDLVVVEFEIEQVFDQSPGPGAGLPYQAGS